MPDFLAHLAAGTLTAGLLIVVIARLSGPDFKSVGTSALIVITLAFLTGNWVIALGGVIALALMVVSSVYPLARKRK